MATKKIVITQVTKNELRAAREARRSRSTLWAGIRQQFTIPSTLRLAVTAANELYVKGTNPKQYLICDLQGRYSHCAADAPKQAKPASRFVVAGEASKPTQDWKCIRVSDLLDALREGVAAEGEFVDALPDGFPSDAEGDILIVDSEGDYVYWVA